MPVKKLLYKIPKHFLAVLYMGFFIVMFSNCRGPVYENYISLDDSNWQRNDSFSFSVPVNKPGKYALFVSVSTTNNYQFANLWLNIKMTEPGGEINKQRFNIPLYSPEGYPLQHDIGPVHIRKFPAARIEQRVLPVDFTSAGTYNFTFTQAMRVNELPGVQKVGLQLKPIN